jgi:hypothetical protein
MRIDARALLFAFRRLVTGPGSSVRVRSPIGSGSAFADELLLRFWLRVRSRSSFLRGSPIVARPLLIAAHRGLRGGCRAQGWVSQRRNPPFYCRRIADYAFDSNPPYTLTHRQLICEIRKFPPAPPAEGAGAAGKEPGDRLRDQIERARLENCGLDDLVARGGCETAAYARA